MEGAPKSRRAIKPEKVRLAKLLVQARKLQGYATAYAFYHNNGGAKKFGFSYHHYLLIEKGARLPSRESFKAILEFLNARNYSRDGTWLELIETYMRAVLNGDAFFDPIFAQPEVKPPPAAEAESEDVRVVKPHSTVAQKLTSEQEEVELSSPEAFWVFSWLKQTGQQRTAAELAQVLRLSESRVLTALDRLTAVELIVKSKDQYHSPDFESGPALTKGTTIEKQLWVGEEISQMIERSGLSPLYPRYLVALEDPDQVAAITTLAKELMSKILAYRPQAPVKRGTLVSIEARVSSILPILE